MPYTPTIEQIKLLQKENYSRSGSMFLDSFSGNYTDLERWYNNYTKPINEGRQRIEGVIPMAYGFAVLFCHGKLCPFSLLNFPKWATEENYSGCFDRLIKFIKNNYEWEAGLPAYYNSND